MSTVEIAPIFIMALAFCYLLMSRKSILNLFEKRRFVQLIRTLPLALIILSTAWLIVVISTNYLFGWQTSFHLSNMRRVSIVGNLNILDALSFDWQAKLLYLTITLVPFAFLSLLSPIHLIPGGLWICYALLSNYPPYYTISFHYPSSLSPLLFIQLSLGLSGLGLIISPLINFVL